MENWTDVITYLQQHLSQQVYENWISPIVPLECSQRQVRLEVPSTFFEEWISNNYMPLIQEAVLSQIGKELPIEIVVSKAPRAVVDTMSSPRESRPARLSCEYHSRLNPRYTFDNFIVGSSNQLPHAASLAISTQPGTKYNPLFVYGGVGLGKTHLLHAIGNHILKKDPRNRIYYLSAEEFMNEYVASVRSHKMEAFRQKFRTQCDVLLIDDIQFIAGKEQTQEEFFFTFNALHERNKQIVLTSDKFPKEIPELEERLRSRFQWGLIADIQAPEMETRLAIIKRKADDEGIPLPDDVALFLATSIKSNVRELEGSLINLAAHASLENRIIDLEFATRKLKAVVSLKETALSIERIQQIICEHFNVQPEELVSARRHRTIAFPRQVAMYLCRKGLNASYPEIGNNFGGKDHTTAMAACRKIEQQIRKDAMMRGKIEALERLLGF